MGVDWDNCLNCGKIYNDHMNGLIMCGGCDQKFCPDCVDELIEKYGVYKRGERKDDLKKCPECDPRARKKVTCNACGQVKNNN